MCVRVRAGAPAGKTEHEKYSTNASIQMKANITRRLFVMIGARIVSRLGLTLPFPSRGSNHARRLVRGLPQPTFGPRHRGAGSPAKFPVAKAANNQAQN